MTQRQERHRDRGTQRKRFFLCVPLLLLLLGCASVRPVIKIGLVAPFEGRDRAIGYDAVYAARLAVRQANAQVTQHGGVREIALPPGNRQFLTEVSQNGVSNAQITFGILKVDRVDLVRHGR